MPKKIALAVISLIVLSLIIPLAATQPITNTTIQLAPSTLTVGQGTTFTINITVTNVTNLASWQFGVFYLNTVLICTGAVEGPFLKQFNTTIFDSTINNAYNTTYGWVVAGSALYGAAPGVNGSGTLATITFQAENAGQTELNFSSDPNISYLYDSSFPPPGQLIPFTAVDGVVNVTAATEEIAVTNVTSYKTVIGQGYGGNITVTTENLGTNTETTNVTVYANATSITSQNVTISNGNSANITFTWDTTGFAYGNYTISAYASPVLGETNTTNNNCTGGWVIISIPGDITGPNGWPDGVVNMRDIALVARCFGSTPGSPYWNPNADINNDGIVNMKDIALVARHFGQHT
jgi:hypothetical protein